jgi:ABC-type Fe3+/spermidine/putrescine transport system ATPase subunit
MELLETLNLTKSFAPGETAVADVSLAVHEGEIVCLLGPSGCGKTTLLRLIAGLETPDAGEVWFDGRNVAPIPPTSANSA